MDEEGIDTIKRLKFTGVGLIKATKADLQKERIVLGDIYLLLEARESTQKFQFNTKITIKQEGEIRKNIFQKDVNQKQLNFNSKNNHIELLRKDKSKNHSDGDNKSDDLEDPAGFKALSKFDQAQIRAIWKTNFIGRRISDSDLQKFKQTPTIKRIQQVKQISLHDYFRKKANRHNGKLASAIYLIISFLIFRLFQTSDRFSQKTSNSDILIPSDNEEVTC